MRYKRMIRTESEAKIFLEGRYDEQAEKFPLLRKIPKAEYVAVNLKAARRYYVANPNLPDSRKK